MYLIRLIQTNSNEVFWHVLTRALPVFWPQMTILTRTLTMGNFRSDIVTIPEHIQDSVKHTTITVGVAYMKATVVRGSKNQADKGLVTNPFPIWKLPVGHNFRLRLSTVMA